MIDFSNWNYFEFCALATNHEHHNEEQQHLNKNTRGKKNHFKTIASKLNATNLVVFNMSVCVEIGLYRKQQTICSFSAINYNATECFDNYCHYHIQYILWMRWTPSLDSHCRRFFFTAFFYCSFSVTIQRDVIAWHSKDEQKNLVEQLAQMQREKTDCEHEAQTKV